jgi:hypothetical protein
MENELKGRRVLLSLIQRVWRSFSENGAGRGTGTVEEVLWTEIPIEEGGSETIRGEQSFSPTFRTNTDILYSS